MLTNEQIEAVITAGVKSGAISWLGFKKDADGKYTLPAISPSDMQQARAIEAEVRKNDIALINQLAMALELPCQWRSPQQNKIVGEAIAAARARLLDSDLAHLTGRGKDAWAGVDPQKLREGGGLGCSCEACKPNTLMEMRMIVCEKCGNKRCPHAQNHEYSCTNSNEPGQVGRRCAP